MKITNENVRELAKGATIEVHRPAPHVRASGCTKPCCTAQAARYVVTGLRRFKDGRTRVAVVDSYGSGCTLCWPLVDGNRCEYFLVD